MKAEIFSALSRLQTALPLNGSSPSAFLDKNKADVELVVLDKGATLTSALLGVNPHTLHTWARRRGITIPLVRVSREKLPAVEMAAFQAPSLDYWRGMAEAYKEAFLVLAMRAFPPTAISPPS